MIESLAYYSVKAVGALVRLLPVEAALDVGRIAGWVVWAVNRRSRDRVRTNLRTALGRTLSDEDIRRTVREVFVSTAQNVVELLRFPLMTDAMIRRYVDVEGKEHLEEALAKGKGLIFVTLHLGNWELANLAGAVYCPSYKLLVREQKRHSRLNDLLNAYRRRSGAEVMVRGAGTRDFVRCLKANSMVSIVVDQGGPRGLSVDFFANATSMATGAIRMGLKMGIPVCPAAMFRVDGPHHRLVVYPPLAMQRTGDTKEDVRVNLANAVHILEKHIREQPDQYMWFYKIWKYSRKRSVLVLNDGRTGHLRQSQAVARELEAALCERDMHCETAVEDVDYRHDLAVKTLALAGALPGSPGGYRLLRWALTPASYRRLMSVKPDYVISCGSRLAPVNYFLGRDNLARSVTILKPGLMGTRRFDLAVLPEHDLRRRPAGPVVATTGAPNLITPGTLAGQSEALQSRFSHLKTTGGLVRIGLLIGGDTKDHVLDEQKVRVVINQLKEVCDEVNAQILATTSRRTPAKVESLLQRELKKHPRCKLLILANRHNVPEAVGGILGLSDVLVVSGDSISMISEAASSGKKTLVFPVQPRRKTGPQKHNAFIDRLAAGHYILAADIANVRQAVYDLIKNKIQTQTLDDGLKIRQGLQRIL